MPAASFIEGVWPKGLDVLLGIFENFVIGHFNRKQQAQAFIELLDQVAEKKNGK